MKETTDTSKQEFAQRYQVQHVNGRLWSVTDTETGCGILFNENMFNEQQTAFVPTDGREYTAVELARIMREIGDYMKQKHKDLIF